MLLVLVSGLFLIELACAIVFISVYGFYLIFTETEFYTADLVQNALFDFTTFFIIFNLVLLVLASLVGYKWNREY